MSLSSGTETYDFIEVVGHGRFAEVARFRRQSDREIVAVKRLCRAHRMAGIHEARLLAALTGEKAYNHHIVRFYEGFADNDCFYIVEESMDQSLAVFQRSHRIEIRDIRTIVLQLVTALAKLKDLGVVHSDITFDNIMLVHHCRQPFRVKLADFGSSVTQDELASVWMPNLQPRYVRAPEVVLGYPCSGMVDMWSVGCVMGEMALGQVLFPSHCELELAHSIFGTRGLPSPKMLNFCFKLNMYFDRIDDGTGTYRWQLKPYQGKRFIGPMRHAVTCLDLLQYTKEVGHGSTVEGSAEVADRRCLVDLLNLMLTLEPDQRISPNQALLHPFLRMEHLSQRAIYRQYYNLSLQGYFKAGVSLPQDVSSSKADDSAEETVQEVPEEKKRSLRRSLRSFFTRLFARRRKKQPAATQDNEDPLEGCSSAVGPAGQPPNTCSTSSAFSPEESCKSSSSRSEKIPEEPPKKKGFLRRWLSCVSAGFAGRRSKKSVITQDNNTSP